MQAKEVTGLINRIERDNRRRGLIVLNKKPLRERQFASWSVAFTNLNDLPAAYIEAYSPFLSDSLLDQQFRSKPDLSYRLLLHFKQNLR